MKLSARKYNKLNYFITIFVLCILSPLYSTPSTLSLSGPDAIYVGQSATLNVSGGNPPYTWTSSKSQVATVNNGDVNGVSPGKAKITVEDQDGRKKSINIIVFKLELKKPHGSSSSYVKISGDNVYIAAHKGGSFKLKLKIKPSGNIPNLSISFDAPGLSGVQVSPNPATSGGDITVTVPALSSVDNVGVNRIVAQYDGQSRDKFEFYIEIPDEEYNIIDSGWPSERDNCSNSSFGPEGGIAWFLVQLKSSNAPDLNFNGMGVDEDVQFEDNGCGYPYINQTGSQLSGTNYFIDKVGECINTIWDCSTTVAQKVYVILGSDNILIEEHNNSININIRINQPDLTTITRGGSNGKASIQIENPN